MVHVAALLLGCATPGAERAETRDPVVEQARALLVSRHPAGDRLATVPLPEGSSRRARIEALLARLGDPSTRLIAAEDWPSFLAEVSGQPTVGVGLRELLDLDLAPDGRLVVITTQPGGPAARAGLAPGDVLQAIDGQPPGTLTEAMRRLRGPAGTDVQLTLRGSGGSRTVTLRRQMLLADADGRGDHVRAGKTSNVLQLALDGFSPGTPATVERALAWGGGSPVVLDLRNNPGGAVDSALAVAGLFVGARDVARAVGRLEGNVLRSTGESRVEDKVAVLVNEGTASAAELLALALRERGRARLFGQRTAGKALVHVPSPLDDGSVLLISAARLVRMDGGELLGRGLGPDVPVPWPQSVHPPLEVPGAAEGDPQLAAALRWLASG